METLLPFIIALIAIIAIFLIFRFAILWFWGIDKMLDNQVTTNKTLLEISKKLDAIKNQKDGSDKLKTI
jgi:hypothetical protein